MAYNSNIPQASDQLNNSQPQILANFQALASFGNGYADFPVQGVAPTLSAGDTGLYTFANATTSKNELYVIKPANGTATNIPFTASSLSNSGTIGSYNGWSYLPSGFLIKWGIGAVNTDGEQVINVASISGGPAYTTSLIAYISPIVSNLGSTSTAFYAVMATIRPDSATGNITINAINSVNSFTAISYLVIGV